MTTTIGIIGNDVPRQLVMAADAVPRRLTGTWDGRLDARASALLGAVDPAVTGILTEILAGRHDDLAGLVVCNDAQAHLRLFYVLRMLCGEGLPPVHLLDLPRLDSPAARRFAAHQLTALSEFCAGLSGASPTASRLRAAAAAESQVRAALVRLRARRRAASAVPGADALSAIIEACALPVTDAVAALDAVVDPAPSPSVRVHVTGSSHPDPTVYAALEARGLVVVSDDHSTGDQAWIGESVDSGELDEVCDGLVELHFARTGDSAGASIAARAALTRASAQAGGALFALSLIREDDEAPAWDFAAVRDELRAGGIPALSRRWIRRGQSTTVAAEVAAKILDERVAS